MSKLKEKEKAIKLRLEGKSYTEIKEIITVSKSTLSCWLKDMPLSESRMKELRADNPRRIERYRETMRQKREKKLRGALDLAKRDIGKLSNRDLFIAGLSLYWAEGTKNYGAITAFSNTDPAMVRFFLEWLYSLKVPKEKIRIRLHLYADMNIKKETAYWVGVLQIPHAQFGKPYIKKSRQVDLSYKTGYKHGTCNVMYGSRELNDYVLEGIRVLREKFEK